MLASLCPSLWSPRRLRLCWSKGELETGPPWKGREPTFLQSLKFEKAPDEANLSRHKVAACRTFSEVYTQSVTKITRHVSTYSNGNNSNNSQQTRSHPDIGFIRSHFMLRSKTMLTVFRNIKDCIEIVKFWQRTVNGEGGWEWVLGYSRLSCCLGTCIPNQSARLEAPLLHF